MPRRPSVALLASLGVIGLAVQCFAQQGAPTRQPQPAPESIRTPDGKIVTRTPAGWVEQPIERPADVLALDERVTIDFKGGTVAQYIAAVAAAAAPKAVNILVPAEIRDVPLPEIRLQSVTLWTAWSALEPAIRAQSAGLEIKIEALGQRTGSNVSSEAVQILVFRGPTGAVVASGPRSSQGIEVVVISIADLVEPRASGSVPLMTPEDVLAAVESAVLIAGDTVSSTPVLKYHPASGVLISRGTYAANALVREVVGTIRQNAAARGDQLDRAKLAKDVYEQRLNQARAQLEAAESDAESAGRRFVQLEKAAQSGAISKDELDSARDSMSAAERRADHAKQQLTMIERMGVESVQTELAIKGQKDDLSDRVAQLERDVEALKTLLSMSSGRPTLAPPGRSGR